MIMEKNYLKTLLICNSQLLLSLAHKSTFPNTHDITAITFAAAIVHSNKNLEGISLILNRLIPQ
jgi:hypothetical protein